MRDPSCVMVRDSVPLLRTPRTHCISDQRRWRRLVRVAPRLKVNLVRQELDAAHRESLWATRRRGNTRLARTAGGKSRWRINVACGRPVRCQMTRAQMEVARSLSLSKHLVYFHWAGESRTDEVAEDGGDDDDGEVLMEEGYDQEVEEGGVGDNDGEVAVEGDNDDDDDGEVEVEGDNDDNDDGEVEVKGDNDDDDDGDGVGRGSQVDLFSVLEQPIGKCNCHMI